MKIQTKLIITTFFITVMLLFGGYMAISTQARANEDNHNTIDYKPLQNSEEYVEEEAYDDNFQAASIPPEIVNKIKNLVKTGALTPEEAASELELLQDPELTGNNRLLREKQTRTMKPQINYDSYVYNFEVKAHSGYEDNVYKHGFNSFPYVEAFVEHGGRRYFNPAALGISIRADYEKIEISNPNNHDVKVHFFLYKLSY